MLIGGAAKVRHHPQKVTFCPQSFPFNTEAGIHTKQRTGPSEGKTQDGECLVTGVVPVEKSSG